MIYVYHILVLKITIIIPITIIINNIIFIIVYIYIIYRYMQYIQTPVCAILSPWLPSQDDGRSFMVQLGPETNAHATHAAHAESALGWRIERQQQALPWPECRG